VFRHILVATDGSVLAEKMVHNAAQLAKSVSARLTAVTVSTPFDMSTTRTAKGTDTEDVYNEKCKRRAEKHLGVVKTEAESLGLSFEGIHAFHDHPYVAIIDTASQRGCDLICMASHGHRGIAALVLGSETIEVLTHSKVPVVVWR
jgi:nucleotide-binding universal stress UspA family protein